MIITSDKVEALFAALVKAQGEMPTVQMDSENKYFHHKYASLGAVLDAVKPVLANNGLGLIQLPCSNENGKIGLTTRVIHTSGQWMQDTMFLDSPTDTKNSAHAAGIVITYLKRYMASAVLAVYADQDVDGNTGAEEESKKKGEAKESGDIVQKKDEIIDLCTKLGGRKDEELMKIVYKYAPNGNPRSIKETSKLMGLNSELLELQTKRISESRKNQENQTTQETKQ